MHKNDWSFYEASVKFWNDKAEEYLEMGMVADMDRCIQKAANAMTLQYEGREHLLGLSRNDFIITGRKGFGVSVVA